MSKLSNMPQTKKAKKDFKSPILELIFKRMSKQELEDILHCSEREARETVSEIAMHYPVITYSSNKNAGYRRAKPIDTLTEQEIIEEVAEKKLKEKECSTNETK